MLESILVSPGERGWIPGSGEWGHRSEVLAGYEGGSFPPDLVDWAYREDMPVRSGERAA